MQVLPSISEREFRARTGRSALARRARKASRKIVPVAVLLFAALLVGAGLIPHIPDPEPPTPVAVAIPLAMPAPRMPSIVAITASDGPAAGFASVSAKASKAIEVVAAAMLEGTWLSAFYGDKQRLREFIEYTAINSGLPTDFFLRLLQQESGLDHRAVSRAGAQGVAQFMPATAAERGLTDPFDPFEAIPKAAAFLREQRAAFGSLGLAAAAYNAGPQRVRNWLAGRSTLPQETRAYVVKITGRSAEEWRQGGDILANAEPTIRTGW